MNNGLKKKQPLERCLTDAKVQETNWMNHASNLIMEDLDTDAAVAWAVFHASAVPDLEGHPVISALLPLFYEKSTPSMIKHGMDVQRKAIEYLNPGQIPVTTFDQPLYALAKFVQWKWPTTYGENVYTVMLGGLHTEMALWKTMGDLLEGCGWTSALTESEVSSSGVADSMLKAFHLTHTR